MMVLICFTSGLSVISNGRWLKYWYVGWASPTLFTACDGLRLVVGVAEQHPGQLQADVLDGGQFRRDVGRAAGGVHVAAGAGILDLLHVRTPVGHQRRTLGVVGDLEADLLDCVTGAQALRAQR